MYMNAQLGELVAIFSYKNEFQCLESSIWKREINFVFLFFLSPILFKKTKLEYLSV